MNDIDRNDLEEHLSKAEENIAEIIELSSSLRERFDDEVMTWLSLHAVDAFAAVRLARSNLKSPVGSDDDAAEDEGE